MIRALLTTTALATLLSTAAVAQDAPANNTTENPAMEAPAVEAPATTEAAPAAEAAPATEPAPATEAAPTTETVPVEQAAPAEGATTQTTTTRTRTTIETGYSAMEGDNLASRIIGATVYSSPNDDAEEIGEINDFVIDSAGTISAVAIGVGGFLGIGEKNVAVDFSELQWTQAQDETYRFVLPTTAEALEAAPEFVYMDEEDAAEAQEEVAEENATASDTGMAAGDPAVVETPNPNAAVAPIDRSTLTETQLTAEEMIGTAVYGAGDEQIGTVGDFLLAEDGSTIDAVIIDVGGFLGIGAKEVAVGLDNLSFSADPNNNRYLFLNVTREQLEAQPDFDRDTYATERDAQRMLVTM